MQCMKLKGLMVTLGSQGDRTSNRVLMRVWRSVCLGLGPGGEEGFWRSIRRGQWNPCDIKAE